MIRLGDMNNEMTSTRRSSLYIRSGTTGKKTFCRRASALLLALCLTATCAVGQVVGITTLLHEEKLLHLKMDIPPVRGLVSTSPGLVWEAKLRLFTYPPIWGNALSNVELRNMDWDVAQQDALIGRPEAAYLLAHRMIRQDLYGRAAFLLGEAASKGHAAAQNDMGMLYFWGLGVPRDMQKAVSYFRRSAANGEVMAELNLGLCALLGKGMSQSYSQAESYISSAARKKQPVAATILAASKAVGSRLARKDLDEAYKLVLCARVYGSDWPLEDKLAKTSSYFVSLDDLEDYIASQIPEDQLRRLQRQLSSSMPPAPLPSQTLSERLERQRKDRPKVVVIGPTVPAPATNAASAGK